MLLQGAGGAGAPVLPATQQGAIGGGTQALETSGTYRYLRAGLTTSSAIQVDSIKVHLRATPGPTTVSVRRQSDSGLVMTTNSVVVASTALTDFPLAARVLLPSGTYWLDVDLGASPTGWWQANSAFTVAGVVSAADSNVKIGATFPASTNNPGRLVAELWGTP